MRRKAASFPCAPTPTHMVAVERGWRLVLAGGSREGGAFPLPTLEKAIPFLFLEASSGGNGTFGCQENQQFVQQLSMCSPKDL